jgi:hypothetical protein
MLRKISPKAFIVSNIAHWISFVVGWILAIAFYCAAETISSDGTASLATIFKEMKSSDGFLILTGLIFFLAPIPAGYVGAKIAPHEKLLNGALSISVWLIFCVCYTIWGSGEGDSSAHVPHWFDALTTYGVPIPAMLGAYIWHKRTDQEAFPPANSDQDDHVRVGPEHEPPMPPTASNQNQARRFGGVGTGLGTFIFLLSQFLLTQHERSVLLVAIIVALGLVVVIVFALKALKSISG